MHETPREPRGVETTAAPDRRFPRGRAGRPRGCHADWLLPDVRQPLAGPGPVRGWRRAPGEASAGSPPAADCPTAGEAPEAAPQGRPSPRVRHRPLDLVPGGRGRRPDLWFDVLPRPRLEDSPPGVVELPEDRTVGLGSGRSVDPARAGQAVAANRRTPDASAGAWSSSTSNSTSQPVCRRTWAPWGRHSPPSRPWDRRDRLSTVSALSPAPHRCRFGPYLAEYAHNIRTSDEASIS